MSIIIGILCVFREIVGRSPHTSFIEYNIETLRTRIYKNGISLICTVKTKGFLRLLTFSSDIILFFSAIGIQLNFILNSLNTVNLGSWHG